MPLRNTLITETKLPIVAFDTRQNRRQLLRKLNVDEFGGGQLGRKLSYKNLLYKRKKLNLIS